MSDTQSNKILDEWYQEFYKNYNNKLVFIEINSGRKYEGLILKSIDRKGSPVRFLNFENQRDKKAICFVASEIKRVEIIE